MMWRFLLPLLAFLAIWFASNLDAQYLIDRDSESWGYPQGGVKLTEPLVTRVGQVQRFNPAVVAERRALSNVKLYLDMPATVSMRPSPAWVHQGQRTYATDLGVINPREAKNAFDAIHFTPTMSGTLRIPYLISASEQEPKSCVIRIEVRP